MSSPPRNEEEVEEPPNEESPLGSRPYRIRQRIAHFTWPWFAATMSTGAVAVVLSVTPNQFMGLQTIGKIFFIFDLVLFVLFVCLITTRFILVPGKLLASLHHPVESLFFGAFWVSAALIITCMESYGASATGSWLTKTLEILFWLYCGIALLVAVLQYYYLFQEERLNVQDAMPAWIFPIYPLLVTGTMAGTLIPSQPEDSALDMWIGAVMFQGLGWTVALLQYSIYLQRLMSSSLPHPSTRPGMFISVGPAGYTSAALISLGKQAQSVLPDDYFGITGLPVGKVAEVIGIVSGIFVFLFAFWFCAISTVAVFTGVRKMGFTLNWWAFIFPNAGLALALVQIGSVLESKAIDGICSALTIILVTLWLFTAVCHVRAVRRGQIMFPGKDEDRDMKEGMSWGRYAA